MGLNLHHVLAGVTEGRVKSYGQDLIHHLVLGDDVAVEKLAVVCRIREALFALKKPLAREMAESPLNRTMPIPAGDFAVEIAAIVIVVKPFL